MKTQSGQRLLTSILCLLLLLAVLLGCNKLKHNFNSSSGRGGGSNTGGKIEDGLSDKTNLYIKECVNKYSNSVMNSYRRYTSWLENVDRGPTGKESLVYGLYDINSNNNGQDCIDAIKKAKDMEPHLPEAESAADNYATALTDVVGQIKAIYPYYNHEDYKDDAFQKGKSAHPALLRAFKNFEQANRAFDDQVDKLEDQVAQKRLTDLKGDSSKAYDYAVVDTSIKAKKILKLVKQTDYSQLKADDIQPMVDDFEKAVDALKTSSSSSKRVGSSFYVSACDDFLKASKELMRRVRDHKPFSDFEKRQLGTFSGWMVEGSPDKLINKYNDMMSRRGMGV